MRACAPAPGAIWPQLAERRNDSEAAAEAWKKAALAQ
jgi:hypothetical protein